MKCPNCQTENPKNAKSCTKCGNPLVRVKMGFLVLAWVGIGLVFFASFPSFSISNRWIVDPINAGHVTEGVIVTFLLGVPGVLLALIGGLLSRSKLAACGIIVAGAIYILSFAGWILDGNNEWVPAFPPGVICVTCGCALLMKRRRGWWFLGTIVFNIVIFLAVFTVVPAIQARLNAAKYQSVYLAPLEAAGGEISLKNDDHIYQFIGQEANGSTWHYNLSVLKYEGVTMVSSQELLPLGDVGNNPLDGIPIPPRYGYENHSYDVVEGNTFISISRSGNELRYLVFRVKGFVPGERLVLEYHYAQPDLSIIPPAPSNSVLKEYFSEMGLGRADSTGNFERNVLVFSPNDLFALYITPTKDLQGHQSIYLYGRFYNTATGQLVNIKTMLRYTSVEKVNFIQEFPSDRFHIRIYSDRLNTTINNTPIYSNLRYVFSIEVLPGKYELAVSVDGILVAIFPFEVR
jgi:hypothetical protein